MYKINMGHSLHWRWKSVRCAERCWLPLAKNCLLRRMLNELDSNWIVHFCLHHMFFWCSTLGTCGCFLGFSRNAFCRHLKFWMRTYSWHTKAIMTEHLPFLKDKKEINKSVCKFLHAVLYHLWKKHATIIAPPLPYRADMFLCCVQWLLRRV